MSLIGVVRQIFGLHRKPDTAAEAAARQARLCEAQARYSAALKRNDKRGQGEAWPALRDARTDTLRPAPSAWRGTR